MAEKPVAKIARKSNRGSAPGERRGGRKKGTPNKATAHIRDVAKQYTEQAFHTLISVMAGGEGVPAAAQVSAAKEILERGWGRAVQPVDGDGEGGPIKHVTQIEIVGVRPN